MEYREFKRIIEELIVVISEENYVGFLREATEILKKYIEHVNEKVKEERDSEKRELIIAEKKELQELYNLINVYINEYNIRLGKNNLNEREEVIHSNIYVGVVKKKIPKFRGADHKIYGPFKPGDIILISEKDFNKLRDRGLITEREMLK